MILRFQSKNGQFRLDVQETDSFPSIIGRVADQLPKDVLIDSITVANRPQGGDARTLSQLQGVSFAMVGLK